jgi:hypothetical protein
MTSEEKLNDSTTVEEVEINIDDIFGGVGADNVMIPEEEKKPSIFSKETVDTSFIDKTEEQEDAAEVLNEDSSESKETEETVKFTETADDVISELDSMISEEEENEVKSKGGRPKLDKSGLFDLATKMIEEGALIPFDDDKPMDEYTAADFRELFEANFQDRESKVAQRVPQEFFQSLPPELQVAAKYIADGGQDLKGLFRTLSQVEEVRDLNPSNESDQAEIARQYLYATNFGTAEEIEQEIEDWKDLDRLEQKANQFKPKLDRMQEQIVARQLAEQEAKKQQQTEAAQVYTENVYNTLVQGELGGLKLDKKTQSMLYSGLVQPNYPSISGKPTNLLGHLLEKYQFVEPRHDLIAEALWLLQDPDGYKDKIKSIGNKAAVEQTVRKLKTEEGRKQNSSSLNTNREETTSRSNKPNRTIKRNTKGFFSR